jgi:hypothetical protein
MRIKPKSKSTIKQKPKSRVKKIICWNDYVGYPVGSHLDEAVTFASNAAEKFNGIKQFQNRYINVWCRGSSGAILAALFGEKITGYMNLKICHVKKEGESSHTFSPQPYWLGINVIIDDFCDTGSTLNAIFEELKESNSVKIVHCLVIGTTAATKREKRLSRKLKFKPKIIITNTI